MHETVELPLPALVTVQSGIHELRYISIMGIRKASSREIKVIDASASGVNTAETGSEGSGTKIEKLFIPPVLKETEFITGNTEEVSSKLAHILKDKGGTI
jgi:electron transfer flavoprotein beta subunit